MATRLFTVEISEQLHERFYRVISTKFKAPKETYGKAINTAVEIALTDFLERMEKGGDKGNQE